MPTEPPFPSRMDPARWDAWIETVGAQSCSFKCPTCKSPLEKGSTTSRSWWFCRSCETLVMIP